MYKKHCVAPFIYIFGLLIILGNEAYSQSLPGEVTYQQNSSQAFIVVNPAAAGGLGGAGSMGADVLPEFGAVERTLLVSSSKSFLNNYKSLFKIRDINTELSVTDVFRDARDNRKVIYQQNYNGVPVFGAYMKTGIRPNNIVSYSSGNYLENISLNTTPAVSMKDAQKIAMRELFTRYGLTSYLEQLNTTQPAALFSMFTPAVLNIYNDNFITQGINSKDSRWQYKLVWHVKANISFDIAEEYIIDAQTGAIIRKADARLKADQGNESDVIRDCSRACSCVYNLYSAQYNYTFGRAFPGTPVRGPNPIFGFSDVDNMYDLMDKARNFYIDKFGRSGANGAGGIGDGNVSALNESLGYTYYDSCSASACSQNQAWYSHDSRAIVVCANNSKPDIFGHEYFHAFASSGRGIISSVLYNTNESGALNEGIADFFGEALEKYVTGSNDWRIGTNSAVPVAQQRNLASPELKSYNITSPASVKPYPNYYNSPNLYCGTEDSGGIHSNSTVISKALYLSSQDPAINTTMHNGCSVYGIGMDKTLKIVYETLVRHATTITTFFQFNEAAIATCGQLVNDHAFVLPSPGGGPNYFTESDCERFEDALQSVQIDVPGGCSIRGTSAGTILAARRSSCDINLYLFDINRDGFTNNSIDPLWSDGAECLAQRGRSGKRLRADVSRYYSIGKHQVNDEDCQIEQNIIYNLNSRR